MVGGATCASTALQQMAISIAPAAPSMWPVAPFVPLAASLRAWSPKTCLIIFTSHRSPTGVLVAWQLM